MTMDWNKVFLDAAKWPEYRVLDWSAYKRVTKIREIKEEISCIKLQLKEFGMHGKVWHISDDLVWAIIKLSLELNPKVLMDALIEWKASYQYTLITWNPKAKIAAFKDAGVTYEKHDPDDEVPAIAVVSIDYAHMFTSVSYLIEQNKLGILPVSYRTAPSHKLKISFFDLDDFKPQFLLTDNICKKYPEYAKELKENNKVYIRPYGPIAIRCILNNANLSEADIIKLLLMSQAGSPRWLGALFYLMNKPKTVRYVQGIYKDVVDKTCIIKDESSSEPVREQTIVTYLPKEQIVTKFIGLESTRERKKTGEHEVVGFWSYSKNRGIYDCDHKWPLQPSKRQLCESCGALRWWKPPSKRGNGLVKVKKKYVFAYQGTNIQEIINEEQEKASGVI